MFSSLSLFLEGLLTVTDEELKEAGVEDPVHRATILSQLLRHKPILDPYSGSKQTYNNKDNKHIDMLCTSAMHTMRNTPYAPKHTHARTIIELALLQALYFQLFAEANKLNTAFMIFEPFF